MNDGKVLLVDDEIEFTQALAERLETRGLKVDAVSNGKDALQKVKGGSYDAVFLDLAMPEMDGIETLKRLLAENPDLQVVLLTGHATVQSGIQAVKQGAMDFLEKPAKLDVIMEKIKQAKTNRILLIEKQSEEKIKKIMGKMGW
jgi:DNA-binding NtrC family response regulator